jgi:hypothetical protein
MQFANQPAKTWWKNPVLTGGGLNRLVGFWNTAKNQF